MKTAIIVRKASAKYLTVRYVGTDGVTVSNNIIKMASFKCKNRKRGQRSKQL